MDLVLFTCVLGRTLCKNNDSFYAGDKTDDAILTIPFIVPEEVADEDADADFYVFNCSKVRWVDAEAEKQALRRNRFDASTEVVLFKWGNEFITWMHDLVKLRYYKGHAFTTLEEAVEDYIKRLYSDSLTDEAIRRVCKSACDNLLEQFPEELKSNG